MDFRIITYGHAYIYNIFPNHTLRLRRQCVIKSSSVSEDALKLWKTRDGRTLIS